MSAPFKFKLKVKQPAVDAGGSHAAHPSAGTAPLPQRGQDHYAATTSQPTNGDHPDGFAASQQPAEQPAAVKRPFKFKLKVANSAAHPPPAAAPPGQQHWDAPHVAASGGGGRGPPAAAAAEPAWPGPAAAAAGPLSHAIKREPVQGIKREAPAASEAWNEGAPAPPPIKKIKLTTGKPGILVGKKPIIKFKPPPKQPRDAPLQPAATAAAAALPIVRLMLPPGGGGGGGGAAKRMKPKGPKVRLAGGPKAPGGPKLPGGPRKSKKKAAAEEDDFDDDDEDFAEFGGSYGGGAAAAGHGGGGGGAAKRPKRSRIEMKELRDLGIEDLEDYNPDVPLQPRTFTLRSTHAAAAAAAAPPSSTGFGLSGGPAPSDARTGVSGGGAAAMDTAGTEAHWAEEAQPPFREQPRMVASAAAAAGGPPKRDDFERLLTRCQKKDVHSMFKEPVTETIAPGYFAVIKQPMDFGTMRSKAGRGEYTNWEELRADMRLMFTNALTYNAEGGHVYNYAKLLMGQCDRIVELAMQGKTDFRSSATITRKHNAAVKAQQRVEREALRQQARAEQRAAQEAKVLKKAGLASSYDEHEDENIRNSYRRPVREPHIARWRGLGAGTNAEGVGWGSGRQVLRPVNPWLPPGMYALSLARFAANLTGRARELVLQRATASTAVDEAAERALQQQLAKKVPMPLPPHVPAAAAAAAPTGGAAAGAPGAAAAAAASHMHAAHAAAAAAAGMSQQQQRQHHLQQQQQQPNAMHAALGAASAAAGSAAGMSAAAPSAMLHVQQQLMMQAQQAAAAGRAPGSMMGGMQPGGFMRPPGQQTALPAGATITFMPTAQGMVPFLIQPGQPPIMMMAPNMAGAAGQAGGQPRPGMLGGGAAGGMGMQQQALLQSPLGMPAFQPQFMPGMQPRPKQ